MTIGEARHIVTLAQPGDPLPDGLGGYTEQWTPLNPSTLYVSITAATARDLERIVAGATQATATHVIRGRWHPGITTETRLTFEGRVFEVRSVQNDEERDRTCTIVATEIK